MPHGFPVECNAEMRVIRGHAALLSLTESSQMLGSEIVSDTARLRLDDAFSGYFP